MVAPNDENDYESHSVVELRAMYKELNFGGRASTPGGVSKLRKSALIAAIESLQQQPGSPASPAHHHRHDVEQSISSISRSSSKKKTPVRSARKSAASSDRFSELPTTEYADVYDKMNAIIAADNKYHFENPAHDPPAITWFAALTTYLGYAVLIVFGHIRDFFGNMTKKSRYLQIIPPAGYAPLLKSWENFYTRRLYHRIQDVFNRPVSSSPGAHIQVMERVSDDGNKTMHIMGPTAVDDSYENGVYRSTDYEGNYTRSCLNLGSYNYLGFADDWQITCKKAVVGSLDNLPVSCSSSRLEVGTSKLHSDLEALVARFIGKEDAVVLNMGFNTNATTIPALVGKGDLIISDELNHTSIVNGARVSGAAIRTFKHNDADNLDNVLREAIVMGAPRTRRPWKKIMVMVEGIYSMEGEYCNLKTIVAVCKKYGVYLYLDEAHSIGAMGPTGRGCCEYSGVDPNDVDVLMGTFTKSFGGMGGYIAASKECISFLRTRCSGSVYHNSLSPVVCQQILSAFKVIMGEDGSDIGAKKLRALRDNSNYFRMRLNEMGLHVLGNYDSPIMPVMLYNPTKIPAFSRECYKRGLAVVVVGFPACPILLSRARFCISAGHTREDLDMALEKIDEICDVLKLRYNRSPFG
jgi:serine palmitoyltransferase